MRYPKGEFINVPNKHALEGMKGATQAVYLWICEHADDYGRCFPAKERIAKKAGVSKRSVSDAVNELVGRGVLKKSARRTTDGSNRQTSNLYQIILVAKKAAVQVVHGGGAVGAPHGMHIAHGEDAPVAHELNPSNKIHMELNKSPALSGGTAMVGAPSAPMAPEKIPENPAGDGVAAVIDQFKLVNEAYAKFFNQPPQRKAVKSLLERHSHQEIVEMLQYVRDHAAEEYAITVSSPMHLEEKWSRLEIKRKQRKGGKTDTFTRTQEEIKNPKSGEILKI